MRKTLIGVILALACSAYAQQDDQRTALIQQLKAPHWTDRAEALDKLMHVPGILRRADVREAIIALQEKENLYSRTSDPNTIGDLPADEGYSDEYETNMITALMVIADQFKDGRAIGAAAASNYNPDSKFGSWLADQPAAVPRLASMLAHDLPVAAGNAAYVLGVTLDRDHRVGAKGIRAYKVMDDATAKQVLALIRGSLNDPNGYKRMHAIEALGMAGNASDIPALQELAAKDKKVSEWATAAVHKLQTKQMDQENQR